MTPPAPPGPRRRLDAVVRERQGLSWNQARDRIASGKIWRDGTPLTDPGELVEPDVVLELRMNAPRAGRAKPGAQAGLEAREIVYQDSQLIVVDKPAGLSSVPYDGPGEGRAPGKTDDSLEERVRRHFGGAPVFVVHRLDRDTSGLIAFARTEAMAEELTARFRRRDVHRRYLAIAHGEVRAGVLRAPIRVPGGELKDAVTHVAPLARLRGATLVECRLETGRTHQIRIHLAEAGHPLLGERLHLRGYAGEPIAAPRILLHAAELGFGDRRWKVDPPADFADALARISPERR